MPLRALLLIILSDADIAESHEDTPGVIFDYDAKGNLVALEIVDASRTVQDPSRIEVKVVDA